MDKKKFFSPSQLSELISLVNCQALQFYQPFQPSGLSFHILLYSVIPYHFIPGLKVRLGINRDLVFCLTL